MTTPTLTIYAVHTDSPVGSFTPDYGTLVVDTANVVLYDQHGGASNDPKEGPQVKWTDPARITAWCEAMRDYPQTTLGLNPATFAGRITLDVENWPPCYAYGRFYPTPFASSDGAFTMDLFDSWVRSTFAECRTLSTAALRIVARNMFDKFVREIRAELYTTVNALWTLAPEGFYGDILGDPDVEADRTAINDGRLYHIFGMVDFIAPSLYFNSQVGEAGQDAYVQDLVDEGLRLVAIHGGLLIPYTWSEGPAGTLITQAQIQRQYEIPLDSGADGILHWNDFSGAGAANKLSAFNAWVASTFEPAVDAAEAA